ncbi:MAG: hypothetical protein PUK73_02025 [Spirochaetota bacterium]|uniref:hypothetical protein n=1 Tax=Candidatus Avelusimicrobium faecicola TaxID=3416205 RepID=UPI002A5C0EB8|nr:hypothetical protein [Spirochaetota bacterium]
MHSYLLSIQNVIAAEIKTLEREALLLSSSHLSHVLDLMQNTQGRIVFTGMGKSGIIAQKIVKHIITDVPMGERILVNDNKPSGLCMSFAISKERNSPLCIPFTINLHI